VLGNVFDKRLDVDPQANLPAPAETHASVGGSGHAANAPASRKAPFKLKPARTALGVDDRAALPLRSQILYQYRP
jgi:hypothetical protein